MTTHLPLPRHGGRPSSVSTAKLSRETIRRILGFARPHRGALAIFLVVSVGVAVLGVVTPVLAGDVVNTITGEGPVGRVVWLAVVMAAVALGEAALGLLSRWLSSRIGEGLIYDLRTAAFTHVQRLPIAFFRRARTGALVSRLNNDVIGAQRVFSTTLSGVVSNVVSLVLTAVVMLAISWQVTVLSVLLLPIFLVPARLIGKRLAAMNHDAAQYNAAMSSRMTERFSSGGATLVKLLGRPADEADQFSERARRVRDIGVRMAMLQTAFMTALTLVSALALALVYGLGGTQALRGLIDAGAVVTLAMLLTRLYAPLTMLANARVDIISAVVSFERVFEVLDIDPAIQEHPRAVRVPAGPAAIEFDEVRFSYPSAAASSLASLEDVIQLDPRPGDDVLRGLTFEVPAGDTVALVGSSGAGKSTIASLVPRLYDVTSGAVRIAGSDVRDLTFGSLRESVAVAMQDGHLFHESIRDNLLLAAPGADDAALWDALQRARMEHVVAAMPDGLETVIGDRGHRLSGGEQQRLAIARLLLGSPRVVVLDEATSSLDATNEAHVQAALDEAMAGRTALVIAHRLSTIRHADEILVIEDGQIAERGRHGDLLTLGGRYTELYETQFAAPEDRRRGLTPDR